MAATLSKKIAFRILRAIGAATWPPLQPRSMRTTTTTSGSLAGANAANHAWSSPREAFELAIIGAVPDLPTAPDLGMGQEARLLVPQLDPGRMTEAERTRILRDGGAAVLEPTLIEEDVAGLDHRPVQVNRAVATFLPVLERPRPEMELAAAVDPVEGRQRPLLEPGRRDHDLEPGARGVL